MAEMNRELYAHAETLFLLGDRRWSHLSSSLIKEVARFGGEVTPFLPPAQAQDISDALRKALGGSP